MPTLQATGTLFCIATIAESNNLKINAKKTKVMTTDGSPAKVYLNKVQIKQVPKFKYLASLVQEKVVASSNGDPQQNQTGNGSVCILR